MGGEGFEMGDGGYGGLSLTCSVQKESVITCIMTTEFTKRNGSDYWRRGMRLQSCLEWGGARRVPEPL